MLVIGPSSQTHHTSHTENSGHVSHPQCAAGHSASVWGADQNVYLLAQVSLIGYEIQQLLSVEGTHSMHTHLTVLSSRCPSLPDHGSGLTFFVPASAQAPPGIHGRAPGLFSSWALPFRPGRVLLGTPLWALARLISYLRRCSSKSTEDSPGSNDVFHLGGNPMSSLGRAHPRMEP